MSDASILSHLPPMFSLLINVASTLEVFIDELHNKKLESAMIIKNKKGGASCPTFHKNTDHISCAIFTVRLEMGGSTGVAGLGGRAGSQVI